MQRNHTRTRLQNFKKLLNKNSQVNLGVFILTSKIVTVYNLL